ncbi:MAG: hypothetical protein WC823_05670 [Parcubacteria group bacterium]|jgi:uncharacterized membrane protein
MGATNSREKKDYGLWQLFIVIAGMVLVAVIVDIFLPDQWMRVLYYLMAVLLGITITLLAWIIINLRLPKHFKQ